MALLFAMLSFLLCETEFGSEIDMDGKWEFSVDPLNVGERERWFDTVSLPSLGGYLSSPGAWQAQGVGNATELLNNQYIGVAWYRKSLYINNSNLHDKKRIFFWIGGGPGGVMRSATVYANGIKVGHHVGYWKPLEMELSGVLQSSNELLTVAVAVDSRWNTSEEGLWGSGSWYNSVWDGYSYGGYGGIVGRSKLLIRESMWIDDSVHVATVPVSRPDGGDWGCQFRVQLAGQLDTSAKLSIQVAEWSASDNLIPVANVEPVAITDLETQYLLQATVSNARLWYPGRDTPLYTAIVVLKDSAGQVLSEKRIRFGIRSLKLKGNRILWNGERLYLRGYGDDAAYGHSVSPPFNKTYYREQLQMMRPFGFNYIRLHTHALPTEFFDACDEMGFLVQVELPIEYSYGCSGFCPGTHAEVTDSVKRVYNESFASFVQRYSHHPSIFGYVLSNEVGWDTINRGQFAELYRFAKAFDPDRPCWWSDGALFLGESTRLPPGANASFSCNGADPSADISNYGCFADIIVPQSEWAHTPNSSDEGSGIPADFAVPSIIHEAADQRAFPRLQQQLTALSKSPIKPEVFFGQPLRDMTRLGLLAENELWALASEKLYTLTMKASLENYLLDEATSGFEWWTGFDFIATATGLIAGDENNPLPKPGIDRSVIASVQSEVTLLIQRPVALQKNGWEAGTFVNLELFLCNLTFAGSPQWGMHAAELVWEATTNTSILANGSVKLSLGLVPQGDTKAVATAAFSMPELREQGTVHVKARLEISGAVVAQNHWQFGVFPRAPTTKRCKVPVFVSSTYLLESVQTICDEVQVLPSSGMPPGGSTFVVVLDPSYALSKDLVLAAQKVGAVIILLSPSQDGFFPICQRGLEGIPPPAATTFRQAWWMRSGSVGTIVYNHTSLTAGLGEFLDFRYQDLIDGAFVYNLDTASEAMVHIRSLPAFQSYQNASFSEIHNLALLWEARLPNIQQIGGGRYLVSGLKLLDPNGQVRQTSQALFILRRLVQYATEMAGHEPNSVKDAARLEWQELEGAKPPIQSFCNVGAEAACQGLFNDSIFTPCEGDYKVVQHVSYSGSSDVSHHIDAVYIRVAATDASARLRAVIYSALEPSSWCPSGVSADKLLAVGEEVGSLPGDAGGWVRLPLGGALREPLQPGTYWIGALFSKGMQCSGDPQRLRGADIYNANPYSSGASNPFGIATTGQASFDVFATVSTKPIEEVLI